ncbi:hypothetical protein LJR164_001624 [Phenylobacterium sp. LjRoot164]|uniref:portal protein n=1 Tax=unclassified Phenylobacterium TaxID=2640670 RepID=UPI003ECEF16A
MANAYAAPQDQPTTNAPADDNLPQLIAYYEEAESASYEARQKSERDRDYVDNKQLTDAEVRKLQERGQPPVTLNVIRSRANFLGGMEKKQRRDPKAYPRNNPNDLNAAEAFTQGMRYVVDKADYQTARSLLWKNLTIEGFGGIEVAAVPKQSGVEIQIKRMAWDRLFYDPHSAELDFSDAKYKGAVQWMDYDDALARAVKNGMDREEAKTILDQTMDTAPTAGQTYDDKPSWTVWADRKRRRVRFVMIWHRDADGWKYCEFTRGGKLLEQSGAYVDQEGETYCPWVWESANVDRDNNRYGEVRHLIDPQDEINKRQSKALHLLSVNGVIADEGAVNDIGASRRELARPDFWLTKNPGTNLEIVRGLELAAGHAQLGERVMRYVGEAGPNQALLGKGTQDQSGRAIEAQQAGGLVEQSDLMDTLRRLDRRIFTTIAWMMKQFWTSTVWIRVTDDELAPEYVGLNEPLWVNPLNGETAPESAWRSLHEKGEQLPPIQPALDDNGQPKLNNNVAELDMDILVSDAPDAITLDGENFQALMDLMGSGLPPPMLKLAIEMHPGLAAKRKKQLTDLLEELTAPQEPNAGQSDQERLAKEMAEAKIAETRANTYSKLASGSATLRKSLIEPMPFPDVSAGMMDDQAPPPGPVASDGNLQPLAQPPMPVGPQSRPDNASGPPVGLMSGRGPMELAA